MEFNFKTDVIWKHKDVIGIDIGMRSIKIVQLEKHRDTVRLVGFDLIDIPENFVISGIITEPEKLAKIIKEHIGKKSWGNLSGKRVNTSLPESRIFTRILTLPHMNRKEMSDAIMWEATQYIPISLADLYLDWKIIGENSADKTKDDIVFAATPKIIVSSYLQLFELLELEVMGVETNMSAVTRAVMPRNAVPETVLVIDIGAKTTNIAVFDSVVRVTGSTLVGGEDFVEHINKKLGIHSPENANIDYSIYAKENLKLEETVNEDLEQIIHEINHMLEYYAEKINIEDTIKKVILCGGSASLPGLPEYFTEKLQKITIIGDPWANVSAYPVRPISKSDSMFFANAIGLALAGVDND
jgi:type IV pilus assembly protein PilM